MKIFLLLFVLCPLSSFSKEESTIDFSKICFKDICFRSEIQPNRLKEIGFKKLIQNPEFFFLKNTLPNGNKARIDVYFTGNPKKPIRMRSIRIVLTKVKADSDSPLILLSGLSIKEDNLKKTNFLEYKISSDGKTMKLIINDPSLPFLLPIFSD